MMMEMYNTWCKLKNLKPCEYKNLKTFMEEIGKWQ